MSDDLARLPASDLREKIASKQLSPVELMTAVLARAEKLQPVLNCFITLVPEQAMAAAKQAEDDVMQGKPLGLLHGIPYAAKDLVNTAGVRTTFGSLLHENNVPKEDAVAIARMKQAGAILFGKTTTPEFGHKALTDAPLFGRTRNAWSAERTSGGSSGGAAVAVAAGIGPMPAATATAAPPLEPPEVRSALQALRVRPNSGASVSALWPNSGVVVLPNRMAPAAFTRAAATASSLGTLSSWARAA